MNASVIPPSFRVLYIFVFLLAIICASMAISFGFGGCSGVRYFSDADPSANFRAYHTFALIEEQHYLPMQGLRRADIMEATIEQSLDNEMQRRAMTVDENSPDLLVKYYVEMNTDTKISSQPIYRSRPVIMSTSGWRPRYYVTRAPVVVGTRNRSTSEREGVLVIDIIDRATNKVIWHGWSEEPIQKVAELAPALADNVHDIMKAYPIQIR
jgi:hypothetical protein